MNKFLILNIYLWGFISCSNAQYVSETPKEFKNKVEVKKNDYQSDSLNISVKLNSMILRHEDFFYPYSPEYVDTTTLKIILDTILYNKEKNKIFVLVNIDFTAKEFIKEIKGELKTLKNVNLFNGMGISVKRMKNSEFKFNSYGIEVGNYDQIFNCKFRLREIYLTEISSFKQNSYNLYYIDDIRMWEEPMWDKF